MKVSLTYSENLHFTATARHFENIHVDESEAFHGDDLAPSPIEYVLIGTGGCIGSTFMYCLKKNKVVIEKLEVDVEGILKHSGPNNSLKLIKIIVGLVVTPKEGGASEKIDLCHKTLMEYCPIFNAFTKGIPLNIDISNQMAK